MTEQERLTMALIDTTVRGTLESLGLGDVHVSVMPLEHFRGYVEIRAVAEVTP